MEKQNDINPEAWPACSICTTPYVLRRVISVGEGPIWVWQHDCSTKAGKPAGAPCRGSHPMLVRAGEGS
jgi:hypothetical protein